MKASRSIAKNTALLTLGVLAGRALGVLVFKKMSPILGEEGVGIWGTATDLVAILLVMANFGLGTLLTREITRRSGMTLPLFLSTMKVRWAMGVVAYLFLVVFTQVKGYGELKTAAFLVTGLAIFIESTAMACDAVLQAHEKVQYQTAGQIVSALVYYFLAVWALDAGYGVMGVVWSNAISRFVRLLVMAPLMFATTGPWRWRDPDGGVPPSSRDMMRLGFPLFLATTFGIIYNKVDTVMLNSLQGDAVSGIYIMGHRALDIMLIVPGLFGTAVFPALARYAEQSGDDARRLGERALRYMMVAMLPLTLFLMFVADPVINFFSDGDPGFADAVTILEIVIWGLPLQAAAIIYGRLLITANHERVFVRIGLVSMLVNVALNVLLIPRYSYYGASVATIVAMTTSYLMHHFYLRRTELQPPVKRAVLGPVVALAVAWLATSTVLGYAFPAWHLSWRYLPVHEGWPAFLVATLATAVVYGIALFGFRIIDAGDLRLFGELRRQGAVGPADGDR